jgi:hypothetical protein
MTLLLMVLLLLFTVLVLLAHEVRADGYGRRVGPRSHLGD